MRWYRLGLILTACALVVAGLPCVVAANASSTPTSTGTTQPAKAGVHRGLKLPKVTAPGGILVAAGTGQVLWARAAHKPRLAASTTKILTALVAVQVYAPNAVLRVPLAAEQVDGTRFGFLGGWHLTREQLLQALLVGSANDAAVTLANDDPHGGRRGFVDEMRSTARALGCTDSTWIDPSGLDAPGEGASPADLALLGRALLAQPELASIVDQRFIRFHWPGRKHHVEVVLNHDLFVALGDNPGAIGIKAGYTVHAGDTLVAAERRQGRVLIAVVLHSANELADAKALFAYGWSVKPAPSDPVVGLAATETTVVARAAAPTATTDSPGVGNPAVSTAGSLTTPSTAGGALPAPSGTGSSTGTPTAQAGSSSAAQASAPAALSVKASDAASMRRWAVAAGVVALLLVLLIARRRHVRRRRRMFS